MQGELLNLDNWHPTQFITLGIGDFCLERMSYQTNNGDIRPESKIKGMFEEHLERIRWHCCLFVCFTKGSFVC